MYFRYILYLLYIIGIAIPDSENQLFHISLGEREWELIRLIIMVDQVDPHILNVQRLANYEATGLFVTLIYCLLEINLLVSSVKMLNRPKSEL